VRGHDSESSAFHDPCSEGRKNEFSESPLRDISRSNVSSAIRLAVAGEVLHGSDDVFLVNHRTRALKGSNSRHAHTCNHVMIFAISLFRPTPARVACHV